MFFYYYLQDDSKIYRQFSSGIEVNSHNFLCGPIYVILIQGINFFFTFILQTIAAIPVEPQGVVQFGSTNKVSKQKQKSLVYNLYVMCQINLFRSNEMLLLYRLWRI